ncbi:hypothetical protein Sa4125_10280 [Aureimonas sp. SA4125]|uniref:antifreeze protein n=1 Tax=Aureimonas sp. SA4125 TaxID=2826993 RepID=UPI001CC72647|nr:antifreeze protein [Aureimonas sp. SA4125]BDA83486.1 hypothetical protein Sa4125_10280 [Aureimonas sp. SA4125]
MKTTIAALAALLILGATAAEAGQRWYPEDGFVEVQGRDHGREYRRDERRGGYDDVIPERRIIRMLSRQGFVSVDDIRLRRGRYIVEAVRPNGALVRLSVDAYDGDILSRERIGWSRDGGPRHPGRDRDRIEFDLGGPSLGIYRR